MPRGPKKHLKRLVAPKSWVLDKLGGVFSVKPSSGPHKMAESLPIAIFLRLGCSTAPIGSDLSRGREPFFPPLLHKRFLNRP
jgi:small subunit ribosomal protein S4e